MFANLHTQTTVFVHPVQDKHTTGLYQKQTTYKCTGGYRYDMDYCNTVLLDTV